MRSQVLRDLFSFKICRRPTSASKCTPRTKEGEAHTENLSILIQTLTIAEKAAEATKIPFLKGAIATALVIAECVQGYLSNNESLTRIALNCGNLTVDITNRLRFGPDISDDLKTLVADLLRTLERCEKIYKEISSASKAKRVFAQKDNRDTIDGLDKDVMAAQMRFQTLSIIAKDQLESIQDRVYPFGSITLGDSFATGHEWVAFTATESDNGKAILVKRYVSDDPSTRKTMYACDIKAFKKNWWPNHAEYIGGSHPREEYPYIVLRGVTSDHVSDYIAVKFREDNQRGSVEALKLLRDLTNALAYTVKSTNSSSFDISKVHLNDSGKLVVVDLEPFLQVTSRAKDDMPHWRNWQEICIELLVGDSAYEPNPAITYHADPIQYAKLKYLGPILGHIHSGGLRFKDNIESAFKRQGLMLSQSIRRLEDIQSRPNANDTLAPRDDVLRALWHRSRELHYVAHFCEPLDVDIGDIGYITGDPPQFTRLDNVTDKIMSEEIYPDQGIQKSRFTPLDRWITEEVNGIVRHEFRFRDTDAAKLADWGNQRPRLDKDFRLRRINIPNGRGSEPGLVVDCAQAWDCLAECTNDLAANHTELTISPSNLILIVYFKQQSGYATFRMNQKVEPHQWGDLWAREGFENVPECLYFYESPPGGKNGVWGYFSFSPTPGTPHRHWTPETDDAGEQWGWTFVSKDWTVEISKPNVKQYIRYVQL